MLYRYITMVGLAVALLGLASTGVFAQQGPESPTSIGVVATITALDAHTGLATLQTEAGEVFELPKETLWQMGNKVLCDRIEAGRRSRLQHCQPWK